MEILIHRLEMMANSPLETPLTRRVASEILDNVETDAEVKTYFETLSNHGCISKMVGSLIRYQDTHEFFDKYYEDIENLRRAIEEEYGRPMKIKDDLKHRLAWFGFEETTRKIQAEFCE